MALKPLLAERNFCGLTVNYDTDTMNVIAPAFPSDFIDAFFQICLQAIRETPEPS